MFVGNERQESSVVDEEGKKLVFQMKMNDVLEPHFFIRNRTSLSRKEAQKLNFINKQLGIQRNREIVSDTLSCVTGLVRDASSLSIGSVSKKKYQANPLFGYSIQSIVAVSNNTQVFRIKSEVYKKYLNPDNRGFWGEKELIQAFPPQIRLDGSTKNQQ